MSGPVQRAGGILVELDEEGRYVHTFRQSTLNELDTCLERGRLTMTGDMPDVETDAAALGTAVHAGIEYALRANLEGRWVDADEMVEQGLAEFERLSTLDSFEYKKYRHDQALQLIENCLRLFDEQVYPRMRPEHLELPFGPLVIYEDDDRVIQITGTIDCVDRNLGLIDWKTDGHGNKFKRGWGGKAWELDRWGVQPTTYCAAARALGVIDAEGPWPFTYIAFALGNEIELVETMVLRQEADIDWLIRKCLSYTALVEADLDVWPKNDNHSLCSEKWCPAFASCKGASYAEVDWPIRP